MAFSNDVGSEGDWRENISSQLQTRNRQQCKCFEDLITYRKFTVLLSEASFTKHNLQTKTFALS